MASKKRPLKRATRKPAQPFAAKADPSKEATGYPTAGFQIGEYTVHSMLGHGSMCTVFEATDATGHAVALKVFQEGPNVTATMLERFRREVEATKKLRHHPNIITIYTTGKEHGYQYIAMQEVSQSKTLELLMENQTLTIDRVIAIIAKTARALGYAHEHGILHRDVKPTNIMINRFGEPLLSDFGVAALLDWPSCTVPGALTGTPLYMSPEQARGDPVGPESDTYSLGVVLYEALTGVLPYNTHRCTSIPDTLQAVQHEPARRPRQFRKAISPDLEAVILKALAKSPAERYRSGEEFAEELEKTLAGKPVRAQRASATYYARHLVRRHRRLGITVLLILASALGGYAMLEGRVQAARYKGLLDMAHLKNAQYALARIRADAAPTTPGSRVWQHINIARKHMSRGTWDRALTELTRASASCRERDDTRTLAIVQLDQARCQIMRGQRAEAAASYAAILDNPDASPAVADYAQLEHTELALLTVDTGLSANRYALPASSPLRPALACLNGTLAPGEVTGVLQSIPQQYHNDNLLAAALVAHRLGDDRRAMTFLRDCITSSRPAADWPAPFARLLRPEFNR